MNCKQAQEMLPLYAGRDLDENRARLLSNHLESCATCAGCAEEYREAFHLTQQFTPPVFSDAVYAGIRRRVLRQIDEPPARALPALIGGWWRPRLTWALASAFVLALAVFAFYFIASRRAQPEHVAGDRGTISRPDQGNQSPTPLVKDNSEAPSATPRRSQPNRFTNRKPLRPSMAAKMNDSPLQIAKSSLPVRNSAQANTLPNNDATAPDRTLRVEMQTKDPNIRIIWFSGGH